MSVCYVSTEAYPRTSRPSIKYEPSKEIKKSLTKEPFVISFFFTWQNINQLNGEGWVYYFVALFI